MTFNPLVTIIIPCYNQGKFMDHCLQSIVEQSYLNWECLLVNDGSTDETEIVGLKWARQDPRIKYYSKPNTGVSATRNFGLDLAQGEYIMFIDSDDFIHPNKLSTQILDLEKADISICDYMKVSEGGDELPNEYMTPFCDEHFTLEEIILKWEKKLSTPIHCILFKKNKVRFVEFLKNHVDWVFWVEVFYLNSNVKYNRRILAYYRINSEAMTRNTSAMHEGFIKACQYLIDYFDEREEKHLQGVSEQKLKMIMNEGKKSAYIMLKIFALKCTKLLRIRGL